jgi:hypothetical protein
MIWFFPDGAGVRSSPQTTANVDELGNEGMEAAIRSGRLFLFLLDDQLERAEKF